MRNMTLMHLALIFILKADCQTPETTPGPPGNHSVDCATNFIIKKFEGGKDLKVVVSGPSASDQEKIKFEAVNPSNIKHVTQYIWQLGDGSSGSFNDYWHLVDPIKALSGSEAYIPNSSMPMSNDDFGDKHGVIKVEATNPSAVAYSNDPPPTGSSLKNVQVFFRKDDLNLHQPNVPNWFYYWSKLFTNSTLHVDGIKLFNFSTNSFNVAPSNFEFELLYKNEGKMVWPPLKYIKGDKQIETTVYGVNVLCGYNIHSEWPKVLYNNKYYITDYPNDSKHILIGAGNGYYFFNRIAKNDPEGIEVMTETVFHELKHWKIFYDNWKDGICLSEDTDLDGYRDSWELLTPGFNVGIDDSYLSKKYGRTYEEGLCRSEQALHTKDNNNNDWSYDKKIKGKNW